MRLFTQREIRQRREELWPRQRRDHDRRPWLALLFGESLRSVLAADGMSYSSNACVEGRVGLLRGDHLEADHRP